MEDTLNPVVSGLMHGSAIGQQIRRSMMEQQQLEMAQQDQRDRQAIQARAAQLQDADFLTRIQQVARPVVGGMVDETGTFPEAPGLPVPSGPTPYSYTRKADPSRTGKYKTAGGETKQFEVKTRDEQFQQRLREAGLLQDQKAGGAIDAAQKMRDRFGYKVPDPNTPGSYVLAMPSEIGSVGRGLQDIFEALHPETKAAKKTGMTPHAQFFTNGATGDVTFLTGEQDEQGNPVVKKAPAVSGIGLPRPRLQTGGRGEAGGAKPPKPETPAHTETRDKAILANENEQRAITAQFQTDEEGELWDKNRGSFTPKGLQLKTKLENLSRSRKLLGKQKVAAGARSAPAAAQGVEPGATVTLKSGQKVVVKKLNSDGTFDY